MMDGLSFWAALKSSSSGAVLSSSSSRAAVGTKKRSMTSKHLLLQRQWRVAAAIHVMGWGGVLGTEEGGLTMTSSTSAGLVVPSFSCSYNNSGSWFDCSLFISVYGRAWEISLSPRYAAVTNYLGYGGNVSTVHCSRWYLKPRNRWLVFGFALISLHQTNSTTPQCRWKYTTLGGSFESWKKQKEINNHE